MAITKVDLSRPVTQLDQERFDAKLADAGVVDKNGDGSITADEIDKERLPGGLAELAKAAGPNKILEPSEVGGLSIRRPLKEQVVRAFGRDPASRADASLQDISKDMQKATQSLHVLSQTIKDHSAALRADAQAGGLNNPKTAALEDKLISTFSDATGEIPTIFFDMDGHDVRQELKLASDANLAALKTAMTELRDSLGALTAVQVTTGGPFGFFARNGMHNTQEVVGYLGRLASVVGVDNWPTIVLER